MDRVSVFHCGNLITQVFSPSGYLDTTYARCSHNAKPGLALGGGHRGERALSEACERFWQLGWHIPRKLASSRQFPDSIVELVATQCVSGEWSSPVACIDAREYFSGHAVVLPEWSVGLFSAADALVPWGLDSSGTAVHMSREQAFNRACLEFVERQSLTASWRLASGMTEVTAEYPEFLEALPIPGLVRLFEISIFVTCSVILALWTSPTPYSHTDCAVAIFAAGAAASFSERPVARAVSECVQAAVGMEYGLRFGGVFPETMDDIQRGYQSWNRLDTPDVWLERNHAFDAMGALHLGHCREAFLDELRTRCAELFVVEGPFRGCGRYLIRLLAPDLFIGMNDTLRGRPKGFSFIDSCDWNTDAIPFG